MIIAVSEIVILMMIYYEYRRYRIAASPIVILGGIYFLFIPIINVLAPYLGFLKLSNQTILSFAFLLLILFGGGQMWPEFYRKIETVDMVAIQTKLKKKGKVYLVYICIWINIICDKFITSN